MCVSVCLSFCVCKRESVCLCVCECSVRIVLSISVCSLLIYNSAVAVCVLCVDVKGAHTHYKTHVSASLLVLTRQLRHTE